MPTYAVVNGENPGPLQHPAITLVDPDGSPYSPEASIPAGTYVPTSGTAVLTDKTATSNISLRPRPVLAFVDPTGGNNANDGLSWGSAKATLAGAYAAMPGGGAGGDIYVTSGVLTTAAAFEHPTKVNLHGAGRGRTILQVTASIASSGVINVRAGTEGTEIEDLTIDLNKASATAAADTSGIYLIGGVGGIKGCKIRRVEVKNGLHYGIRATNADLANLLELTIDDALVQSCNAHGIWVRKYTDLSIVNSVVQNVGDAIVQGSGIVLDGGEGGVVVGNRVSNSYVHGISTSNTVTKKLVIANNISNSNGISGSTAGGGIVVSVLGQKFVIIGNECDGNKSYGITIDPRQSASDVVEYAPGSVVGNVCTNGLLHGINSNFARSTTFVGNTLVDNASSGIALSDSRNQLISGNSIANNLNGISVNSSGTATGGSGAHYIGANAMYGNTTADYAESGTVLASPQAGFPTAWVVPTLDTGWATAAGSQPVRYRRVGDNVQVEGTVQNTTGGVLSSSMFTLPAGFRPPVLQYGRYPAGVLVSAAGVVQPNASVAASALIGIAITFSTVA